MYCSLENLLEHLSEDVIIQLTDDEGSGEINQGRVDAAIEKADDLIDSYLRSRYTLPLAITPGLIRSLSIDLSIYNLYARRLESKMPESIEARYEKAVGDLQRLQKGDMVLDVQETGGSAPSDYRGNKTPTDREFNDDVWKVF